MQILGFDIFEDIVDHSYQKLENPWDRVEKSIYLNQNLLTTFTMTDKILARLERNLELMLSGVFHKAVKKQIKGIEKLYQQF